ncbi:hypothetical protein [Phyllobacterium chamaecytisi]|uniref:hypothetical protein n=1 Tax=Phyllobacterium chamaecytisi TaxID=2876082 RepID=UPI001CCA3596|nr:hypothetical protein [Phyllobacterium sp. KW56]MBZ9600713.1 hypothetical protein [Phyllobacterium sp. KW56]
MSTSTEITKEDIRSYLLQRAQAYADTIDRKLSFVSQQAVSDSKFLDHVRNGGNFTIVTYQKVIDWIDEQERVSAGEAA